MALFLAGIARYAGGRPRETSTSAPVTGLPFGLRETRFERLRREMGSGIPRRLVAGTTRCARPAYILMVPLFTMRPRVARIRPVR
ncbi:MAG: hypothetical protein LUP92_00575 [Methanomicrobiales archaeon]|nr:hypothetical protein [Methanomicrobiales archaeon]